MRTQRKRVIIVPHVLSIETNIKVLPYFKFADRFFDIFPTHDTAVKMSIHVEKNLAKDVQLYEERWHYYQRM